MSLAGNLEIFPLDEVLLMLTRSSKSGCLRVDAPSTQGRIYLHDGSITLTTVGTDEDFKRQLVLAALVDDDGLRRVENGSATLVEEELPGVPEGELDRFLREHSVESLYRIHRHRTGDFDFVVDLAPRYPTGLTIDPPSLLSLAEARAEEWREIETVVPDMNARYRMIRRLPADEPVSVNPSTWYILSALEGGTSVHGLAAALGVSSFKAAYELAHLVRNELVEEVANRRSIRTQLVETDPEPGADPWNVQSIVSDDPDPTAAEPTAAEAAAEEATAEQPAGSGDEAEEPAGVIPASQVSAVSETSAERPDEEFPAAVEHETFEAAEPALAPVDEAGQDESDAVGTGAAAPGSGEASIGTPTFSLPELPDGDSLPRAPEAPEAPESRLPSDDDAWWSSWSADLAEDDDPGSAQEATSVADVHAGSTHVTHSEPHAEAQPEPQQEEGTRWWAQTMDESIERSDQDSEEFLEGVFEAVGGADDEHDGGEETGFGRGLLKRRLMGTIHRDGEQDR